MKLIWKKYSKLTEARDEFPNRSCVYVQTDRKGRPIRVGKAEKGLKKRYWGGTGYAFDAAMHDSGNLVFVAPVPPRLCQAVEASLIRDGRDVLEYNNMGKKTEPSREFRFIHSGDSPDFSVYAYGRHEMERSRKTITKSDLQKLLKLARADIDSFFYRKQIYKKTYQGREKLVALCQGAALHYIDGKNGVKDFDVWFFYPQKGDVILPYRRCGLMDFGKSKFGKHPKLPYVNGRGVDVLMRSTRYFNRGSPESCIADYLSNCNTKTAKLLSKKAVVGLYPKNVFGKVLWSPPQ